MKRPANQMTRMRDAAELARIILQSTTTAPTMEDEKRAYKIAHRHYCTLSEINVQYRLSTTEDEAISKIYLTLAQAEAEAHNNETIKEI